MIHFHDCDNSQYEYEFHGGDSQHFCENIFQAMKEPKFPEQAQSLKELLSSSHLSPKALAERTGVKVETVRKYLAGYQPAGDRTMAFFKQVCDLEVARLDRAARGKASSQLHDKVVQYAGKLLELPDEKRHLAEALIDHLSDCGKGLMPSSKKVKHAIDYPKDGTAPQEEREPGLPLPKRKHI